MRFFKRNIIYLFPHLTANKKAAKDELLKLFRNRYLKEGKKSLKILQLLFCNATVIQNST